MRLATVGPLSNVILHLAPHPDDELLGAPATLMALRDAGWRVVNLACGLGRAEDQARREEELTKACRLAGFELRLPSSPMLRGADPAAVTESVKQLLRETLAELGPRVVCSPTPHDRHPQHELVACAVRDVLSNTPESPRWWMWALWGPLELPTLAIDFDKARLSEVITALEAHRGELQRNDYRRLVEGRAKLCACLAPELLSGFGSAARQESAYAELLSEAVRVEGRWLLGRPRWLDPAAPLPPPSPVDASAVLAAPGVARRLGL